METPQASEQTIKALGDMAADSGIRTVHVLAWRDLDDPEAGGSEVHAHAVTSIWTQAGIDIVHRTSYAPGLSQVTNRSGYVVVRRAGRYMVFPRAVASEISGRYGKADALVEIWNGMPFMSPTWFKGPSSVWFHHVHGPMWDMSLPPALARAGRALEERIAPKFYRRSEVVTLSSSSRDELVNELGFRAERVHVVHPGVSARFGPGAKLTETPSIVAVGRLVPVKDFARLIRLVERVRQDIPNLQLNIVGEGYERPNLERQIRDIGGEQWINLLGKLRDEELIELYQRSWLLCSVSVREGWGMTLTEAAACGTPCVATDISGHRDAASPGVSGILADSDEDLVNAMVRVLSDRDVRAELSAGAITRAAALSWDATALGTFSVLARRARALKTQGLKFPRR